MKYASVEVKGRRIEWGTTMVADFYVTQKTGDQGSETEFFLDKDLAKAAYEALEDEMATP